MSEELQRRTRSNRYVEAMRRFHARQRLPLMLEDLALRLGRAASTFTVLPIDESDVVQAKYWTMLKECKELKRECFMIGIPWWAQQQLQAVLQQISLSIADLSFLLFRPIDCGAVWLSGSELFERALDLIEIDQDDLMACTQDVSNGIFLEAWLYRDSGTEQVVFDMIAWGTVLIEACRKAFRALDKLPE